MLDTCGLRYLKTCIQESSIVNDYWNSEYQRRKPRVVERPEKTEPFTGSAKKPNSKATADAGM